MILSLLMNSIKEVSPPTAVLTFTVDLAEQYVVPSVSGVPITNMMFNPEGKNAFEYYDKALILSAGYYLPSPFEIYQIDTEGDYAVALGIGEKGNPPLASLEPWFFPWPNYELSIGRFVDPVVDFGITEYTDNKWACFMRAGDTSDMPKISMLGLDTALDNKVFNILNFVKIAHTFPLTLDDWTP